MLGAFVTVGFTYLFGFRHDAMQYVMIGSLALLIGLVLFLTVALNYPYRGAVTVDPKAFHTALHTFDRYRTIRARRPSEHLSVRREDFCRSVIAGRARRGTLRARTLAFGRRNARQKRLRVRKFLRGIGFVDDPLRARIEHGKRWRPRAEFDVAAQAVVFDGDEVSRAFANRAFFVEGRPERGSSSQPKRSM